jgi:3-oxoacyl-[acyl-carrier protein] reductase
MTDALGKEPPLQLHGKTAIVTGAGGGFGAGIASTLAAAGARVACVDIRADAAQATAAGIGSAATAIVADVGAADDVRSVVSDATKFFGKAPDILVNNAGVTHRNQPLLDVPEAEFDRIFRVNVKSIFHFVHAIVPAMRANGGGSIVNIGSVAGIRPRPGLTWYNASKGAVNLLSKSLAVELAPWNIRVNAVCPVMGESGLLTDFLGGQDTPEIRAKFISTIPLGRLSRASDVANAVAFLVTDESAFISGIELPVDGARCV